MWPKSVMSLGMTHGKDVKIFGPLRTQPQEILFVWLKMPYNRWISDFGLGQHGSSSFHALLSNTEIECPSYSILKFVLDLLVSYTKLLMRSKLLWLQSEMLRLSWLVQLVLS